jgi:sugar phosphate permease
MMLCGFGFVLLIEPALTQFGLIGTALAISCAGIFSFGPDTLLSGAGAQDIGEPKAAGTAAALVDGIGHLGAIFSPYVVVFVSERYGWDSLFFCLAGSAFLAGAVLIPIWNLKPSCSIAVGIEENALEPSACVVVE